MDFSTLMATGYIVPPISKLPFLNIMTDVLLTQVPVEIRDPIILPKSTENVFFFFCIRPEASLPVKDRSKVTGSLNPIHFNKEATLCSPR